MEGYAGSKRFYDLRSVVDLQKVDHTLENIPITTELNYFRGSLCGPGIKQSLIYCPLFNKPIFYY